jgi:hypothetical protein
MTGVATTCHILIESFGMPHIDAGTLHSLLTDGDQLALVTASGLAGALLLWHGLGLACCAASRCRPQRRMLARLAVAAPPLARRVAGIATFTIALAPTVAHADAATPLTPKSTTMTAADEPFVRAPAAPVAPAPAPAPSVSTSTPPAPAPPPAVRAHVVTPGDNLWRIAAAEVARVTGRAHPRAAAIVPYWHAVIQQNRATLRSGDPSLIYPGEIVTLPLL